MSTDLVTHLKSLLIGFAAIGLPYLAQWVSSTDWGTANVLVVPIVGALVNWLQRMIVPPTPGA